jgi:hypothetical protein
MSNRTLRTVLPGLVLALPLLTQASAHEIVGNRFFPATLTIDDPGVNDEAALPTVSVFKNGDVPSIKQTDISGEYSKRITDDFAIAVAPTWTRLSAPGGPNGTGASGFQNWETAFKYRFYKDPAHELVMSVGLGIEWGHTGSTDVGAEPFTNFEPTFFFGKGFGDLPDSARWLRPFAVTGQLGYGIPSKNTTTTFDPDTGEADIEHNPRVLVWGGSLQYSLPYLKSSVVDLGLPDFFNHLIPIVEASFETPVSNTLTSGTITTGTINPGVLWVGNSFQLGVEAIIPINRQSGTGVGVIAQLHLFLDDIFPNSLGKPIFASSTPPGRRTLGN